MSFGKTAPGVVALLLAAAVLPFCAKGQPSARSETQQPAAVADAGRAAVDPPAHVTNFTFWKQSGIANDVPASWMASNVTFVETGRASYATDFHAAGGKYAIVYSAANYYYVASDYHSHGDFPESAFAHDASGNRISRPQGRGIEYYVLPNSPQAVETYRQATAKDIAGGAFDFVFADGVSDGLNESLYRMSATPVELSSDADYIEGMKRMLAAAARPVIANGYNNGNSVAIETYVTAPNVSGIYGEECFHRNGGPKTDRRWRDDAEALLFTTSHARYAFCGGHGTDADNRAERLYWLASWWLTYNPTYSVAVEVFESSGDVYAFPEMGIVPTQPVQDAGGEIDGLRSSSGAYVREFRACYVQRAPLGPCAAIVNPSSTSSEDMPQLSYHYTHSLALDENNSFAGGLIRFTTDVPSKLAPAQAVVLAR